MIKEDIIQRADEYLQKVSESDIAKYQADISKTQEVMVNYTLAMSDVFEDEDEYFNKFIYFFLLIHRSYSNRFRFFPAITKETILEVEEEDQNNLKLLMEKGEDLFEEEFEKMIHKHPQRLLIDFITMDLFEASEDDYDDISLDLDNQIFFLLITIVNIYEKSLVASQKEAETEV